MKRTTFRFVLALIITISFHSFAQYKEKSVAGISNDRLQRYDNFINQEIKQGKIPGAAAFIVRNGTVVHKGAFGYRDLADKSTMKVDDIFFIQSMTKPIITVAFMMLYEEGHFMLTDPVSKYLPEFENLQVSKNVEDGIHGETEPLNKEITIEHLLTHTSGLTHGLGRSQLDKEYREEYFMEEWPDIKGRVNNIYKLPLMGQPGEQWYYSVAPDVLSVLIEQFSGMSTIAFLKERIFEPLNMKDTDYNLTKEQQSRIVKVTGKNEDGVLENTSYQPALENNTIWSGVNGLFSTVSDYMVFCQMVMNKGQWNGVQFLSRKTIELMTYNHVGDLFSADGVGFGYGFAVMLDVSETDISGSNGNIWWGGAFNTHFFIDPKEQMIAIFMTQLNPYTNYYHDKMKQLIYQAIID